MTRLRDIGAKVRSKNAGPFWLTIDIFCETHGAFQKVCKSLQTEKLASVFDADPSTVDRYEIDKLKVVKFSLPRPQIQGSVHDRDMHGASWAVLVADLTLD